jgi:hypothetical protein
MEDFLEEGGEFLDDLPLQGIGEPVPEPSG